MQTADDRLKALFASDAPPARDPVFASQVFEALARRALLLDLAWLAALCLLGAALLWKTWPHLSAALETAAVGLAPVAVVSSLAGLLVAVTAGWIWAPRG